MKEKLEELYDGLKERLKSNFLLTFIIIWLLHHWRLFYSIFNFDSDKTLVEKRAYIANYIHEEGMLWLWVFPLLWTFVSMITFYGFSSVSELINIAYHNIRKRIYDRWENKKIKYIEEFDGLIARNKSLEIEIKDLEQRRDLLLGTNKRLEDTIGDQANSYNKLKDAYDNNIGVISKLQEDLASLRKEKMLHLERIDRLGKVEEELKLSVQSNRDLEVELEKLKNLLTYKGNAESTNIEEVFKKNEVWSLRYKDSRGNQRDERFKYIEPDKFVTINKNEVIKISQFHYNKNLKTVTFLKTNQEKGYTERYTKLFEFAEGYFVGKEDDMNVEYRKLN